MQSEKKETNKSHANLDSSYTKILQEGNTLMRNDNTIMNIEIEKDKRITINTRDIKIKYRIGNVFALWHDKNGDPRIVIGPHCTKHIIYKFLLDPFFICLFSFISILVFFYFYSLWDSLNEYVKYFGILIYLIQISAYSYTALVNPGIVKRSMTINSNNELPEDTKLQNFRICVECNVMMNLDEGTSHCDECNVCVEGKAIQS